MADTLRIVKPESEARMERRRRQRWREAFNRDPRGDRPPPLHRRPPAVRTAPSLLRASAAAAAAALHGGGDTAGGPTPGGATLHEATRLSPMLGLARIWQ
jgi:hypothetical protein